MPKRRQSRVYWRGKRAWGDFRDYADVEGRQEPLVSTGERLATTERTVAEQLAAERLLQLKALRANRHLTGLRRAASLAEFADEHLVQKAELDDVTDKTLEANERYLQQAIAFLGARRDLTDIRPSHVKDWITWLRRNVRGRDGSPASDGTVRHHLHALSNLYRTAQQEEVVPQGYNPVQSLRSKPKGAVREARWLEVPEAAALIEVARRFRPDRPHLSVPFIYPLLATFLLTGGRRAEVLGLEVDDVSFDRRTVTFRSNQWRRLKTEKSERVVPLWSQLLEILGEYLAQSPPARLLFGSHRGNEESIVWNYEKTLDAVAKKLDFRKGEIRAQRFRNTYCAARLQTLDHGAPVSPYTVAREMGHASMDMVQRVYGHLGEIRHRAEVVEYRTSPKRAQFPSNLATS